MKNRMLLAGLLIAGALGVGARMSWADDPKPAAVPPAKTPLSYSCPMHPQIQATFPGTCPVCRMALQAKGSGTAETAPMNHEGHSHAGMNMGGMSIGAMSCPHCTMGMGGMSAPAAPTTGAKVIPGSSRTVAGRRRGC